MAKIKAEAKENIDKKNKDPRITDKYVLFLEGIYCQWYKCEFKIDNNKYQSAEQYMMAAKAKLMGDNNIFKKIINESNPSKCKQLGRQVKNWDQKKWDLNKENIVYKGNYNKFKQNENLKKELLNEKYKNKIFVEAASFDNIWGIGIDINDENAANEKKWKGTNLLGKIITKVRDDLLKEQNNKK